MITTVLRRVGLCLVLAVATLGLASAAARADVTPPLSSFALSLSSQAAGAHPDLSVDFGMTTADYPSGAYPNVTYPYPTSLLQGITVQLPPGLLADPAGFATCDETTVEENPDDCPAQSQVGVLTFTNANNTQKTPVNTYNAPVFNQPAGPDDTAQFAIPIIGGIGVVHIDVSIRDDSDYGATATVTDLPSALEIISANLDLWGVPGASAHDGQRAACYQTSSGSFKKNCTATEPGADTFIVNPTSCAAPSTVTASATFYDLPGQSFAASSPLPAFTGCGSLPFAPSLSLTSATGAVGQPDAFTADLSVPQPAADDTIGSATAAVDGVTATLPAGVALSPGVAGGLTACSDAQFADGSHADQTCPLSSEIGTVTVTTPLLSVPLTGAVFVGQQESDNPASGQMYRLFVAADGQNVHLKLIGQVAADPATGRLTATFPQNPQVPFSDLTLAFKGGPRAPLANPPACGTATTTWSISSWADPTSPVSGTSSYPVTGNCALAGEFSPSLTAGTQSNLAGVSSPFVFTLSRPDGEQDISGIPQVTLPLGLNATLAGVPECTDAQLAAAACPTSSQVGTATISAGTGSAPFVLSNQGVYLTGPYHGGPYGLAVVVDAIAGPFDLGTVVVRQALFVDPTTAQVTIKSDPLPTILGGVPLNIQAITLDIDRPGFMRSPTSCSPEAVTAQVTGTPLGQPATVVDGDVGYAAQSGSPVTVDTPFRLEGCAGLSFSPRLAITVSGKGRTRTNSHPRLVATLTQGSGQANLGAVKVALPLTLALDPNNSQHVCSVADAAKLACPKTTIVGQARAVTPILPNALSGDVYLVQGLRRNRKGQEIRTLPKLLVPLSGPDGVNIDLDGQTAVNGREQLVTTFPSIPDASISKFTLTITGGKRGLLVVTGGRHDNLCAGRQVAGAQETGQNDKDHTASVTVHTPACAAAGGQARRRRGTHPRG